MFLPKTTILVALLPLCFSKVVDVTFKDATFRGYSIGAEQFEVNIPSSNSLAKFLPQSEYDKIEFINQNIPVLRENSLANLGSLDELVIESCQVQEIQPGALENVPHLRKLSLKGNKLETIQEGVFNNLDISYIDLSHNAISQIEGRAFNDMPSILYINLDNNNIVDWNTQWFKNTPHLNRLFIQNNSIAKLPRGAFTNLQGNKKFGGRKLTVNIALSYNKIKKIEVGAFEGLREINHLWLDNNLLEDFDENLLNNVDVKELRLNDNNIHCLKGDLSKILKGETTNLDSNPLDCDCFNRVKTWAKKAGKNVEFLFCDTDCKVQQEKNRKIALEKRLEAIRKGEHELKEA